MSNHTWTFNPYKRWKISAQLRTHSPLHIGNGEQISHPQLAEVNNVSACIKDFAGKPYLPGTTLKGKLFAWLNARVQDEEQRNDLVALFGQFSDENKSGTGGRAEFHHASIIEELKVGGESYPYWQQRTQTYIETSTAINRITRTVVDKKLFHTELIPPEVGFEVIITGMMTDSQAALLIAALQAFENPEHAATFGAEDTSGKGRMSLFGNVEVSCMNAQQVNDWLNQVTLGMAELALTKLDKKSIETLTKPVSSYFSEVSKRVLLKIDIQMDGQFLINNPELLEKGDEKNHHHPLLDAQGNPLLSGKSLRGSLRSQAERIIRTLGGACCDTVKPCEPIYKKEDFPKLCLACQVFGATGWQSPVHIQHFKFLDKPTEKIEQNFVAIDRFHGGGKHGAIYQTTSYYRPQFTGFIELDSRLPDWGRGLIALLLRDLNEGDIKLGFGANKGYGGVESITVTPNPFTNDDLKAFREKCLGTGTNPAQINFSTEIVDPPLSLESASDNNPPEHSFYNPYQFIPIKTPDKTQWLDKNDFVNGKHNHSHAIYRSQTDNGDALYRGRLRCKLIAETPFFIGAKKDGANLPAKVENFRLNGKLAIPATSLRGLLSSLTEAASNSALRVLDNGLMSYRKTMKSKLPKDRPLSAIGMVIEQDGDLKLIPLALPTLEAKTKDKGDFELPPGYYKMFPDGKAALKVYLNNAYSNSEVQMFLTNKNTWTPENPQIHYLDLDSLHLKMANGKLLYNGYEELLRRPSRNTSYVIGQNSIKTDSLPIPANNLIDQQKARFTPGILRILGKTTRENDMPETKRHELFIPVPHEFAKNFNKFIKDTDAFLISPDAISRFNELAQQRVDSQKSKELPHHETWLPYHLKGTERLSSNVRRTDQDRRLCLKHGDLVYFRPDEANPSIVAEVAFSAHWRGRVEDKNQKAAKVYDFFPEDLLPFNTKRKSLSPAELLFGFVEEQKTEVDLKPKTNNNAIKGKVKIETEQKKEPEKASSFAGKVRISTGLLVTSEEQLEPETTLKILASPKLPSPSLYFRNKTAQQAYIAKHDLEPKTHQANGRKQYCHALRQSSNPQQVQKLTQEGIPATGNNSRYPWESFNNEHAEQKVKIQPIKSGTEFEFNVDFDNLTAWEWGLLCYALKPSEHYRHKLGMGKPIGLGSVNISIENMALIDRQKRYGEDGLDAKRYSDEQLNVNAVRNHFIATMDDDIRQALELVGDPRNVRAPVHYPQVRGQNIENETYRWFVANDNANANEKQILLSIDYSTRQIPPLTR